jgi:hypothetical protein
MAQKCFEVPYVGNCNHCFENTKLMSRKDLTHNMQIEIENHTYSTTYLEI